MSNVIQFPCPVPDTATVLAAAQMAAASHLYLVIDQDGKAKLTPILFPGMQKIGVGLKRKWGAK